MKTRILAFLGAYLLAGITTAQAGLISASVSTVALAGPNTFSFTFGTPITPILGMADYSFSGSFTLTDGGSNGVSAAIGSLPEFWQLQVVDASNVFTLLDDVGGTSTLVGAGVYNFSAAGIFDCSVLSGGCSSLQLGLSYLSSGGGDSISANGTFDLSQSVSAVPEPVTISLIGAGLAGAIALRRRKKNNPL